MRLPSGFKPHHVARNISFAKLGRNDCNLAIGGIARRSIPEAQTPFWRQDSAAGE